MLFPPLGLNRNGHPSKLLLPLASIQGLPLPLLLNLTPSKAFPDIPGRRDLL